VFSKPKTPIQNQMKKVFL